MDPESKNLRTADPEMLLERARALTLFAIWAAGLLAVAWLHTRLEAAALRWLPVLPAAAAEDRDGGALRGLWDALGRVRSGDRRGCGARGVRVHARRADLQQELAAARELQDVRVATTVAADPDVVLVVHPETVV